MARTKRNDDIEFIQTVSPIDVDDDNGWAQLEKLCEDVFLSAVFDDLGCESVDEVRPIQWFYCIEKVRKKVFQKNPKILKIDRCINNQYDTDKILKAYYIYYNISCKYNIEITIDKFCKFIGIDYNTISYLSAKPDGFRLRQKILADSEQFLASQLTDRRINPIGTLAKLNRWHSWKDTGNSETTVNVTLSESPAALADRYRAKIADNKTALLSDSLSDSDAKQGL